MDLINRFRFLPTDCVNLCLKFTGKVVYRSGKYIDRIDLLKYEHIKIIPRIYPRIYNFILLLLDDNNDGYILIKNDINILVIFQKNKIYKSIKKYPVI